MAKIVAETIKEITREHLEQNNGLLFGQAIKAVGWVNDTVPDCKNIVEFPMSDVSNMGIACGAAIGGRRPIIVIRFQDFMWPMGMTHKHTESRPAMSQAKGHHFLEFPRTAESLDMPLLHRNWPIPH